MHDVFQEGLLRGSEKMPYDPKKAYFYVETPSFRESGGKEGWRVFLRACCFMHEVPQEGECIDFKRFLVVKRTDGAANGKEWEPPKGQMEGKDGLAHPRTNLVKVMAENVKREVYEESRVKRLIGLQHTNLVYEGKENDYPPNTFFQYHIFRAQVTPSTWMKAAAELDKCRANPSTFKKMKRDMREKDALADPII
jgi:8-oxo-dGTP pyrophosphatase MutT (NUDIX family)